MVSAITVHCTHCETAFPVDPAKVPEGGVHARCSECGGVFFVGDSGDAGATAELEGQEAGAPGGAGGPGAGVQTDDFFTGGGGPEAGTEGVASPVGGEASGGGVETPAAPETAEPAFGQRTPDEKAKRLARVLVSDMISYNPDLHRQALARGSLKEDFEEEIEKSWEEYVEQVGEDLAKSTPYWRDALNQFLAEGEEVF
ncbi:MAG: hypothetical protein GWM92_02260 [Gemmatimonadetes bacterium]|nr:hypothetical protein [Gemmatimonadota bacterium]NIR80060.1 hypothetical protein [Gemmatimonadota bacterium]NIT85817.1 hypothetical protein [Gemmatimonadota bacterium]NIU32602.1 hypothetical protein [Gemmatimonadota bacterium]NIU37055.1 hypothetical protein [Gemmatimonadota bacterium]